MAARHLDLLSLYDRNQEATLYVGNVDMQVDEELLWELFIQAGVVKNIHIPRDKVTGQHQGYGFVEFETEDDADYAVRILNFVKLYNKPLRLNKASRDKENIEVGANLFIGNVDEEVDEKLLHDTFSAFGNVLLTKIVRDIDSAGRNAYAFVSYDSFEASDAALAAMNGQFLCNKPIHVSYAYKKDTKGERHGSAAERLIAANRPADATSQTGTSQYGSQMPTPMAYPSPIAMPTQGVPVAPAVGVPHLSQDVPFLHNMQQNVYQPGVVHPSMLPQANVGSLPMSMPPLPGAATLPTIPQNMPPPPPIYKSV
ncbi:spliceosome associated protein, putative [Theileria equi strain WA]|uniref:Spliceosome associated protein, putative n=1 Tax=Theileria equi strain WA TaxID=1537102 RepID=L0AVJ4_THEEQ|nr:spliceosome associated protein, putative [Theileria equi strain WA]AFZ79268.1 spliceosome associated protein, putative [Theileria equi strain WA]|eukprot:XP_004828934.1 spliceosome associated protein, putative [Theileria equi strain WA]